MKFSLSKQAVESLVCPLCKQQCNPTTQGLECKKCNKTYPLKPVPYGNYTIHTPFLHPDENQPAKIFKKLANASANPSIKPTKIGGAPKTTVKNAGITA